MRWLWWRRDDFKFHWELGEDLVRSQQAIPHLIALSLQSIIVFCFFFTFYLHSGGEYLSVQVGHFSWKLFNRQGSTPYRSSNHLHDLKLVVSAAQKPWKSSLAT